MKQYFGFASGLISFACFTIYNDRREFNRLTKELEERYPKKNVAKDHNCTTQPPQK